MLISIPQLALPVLLYWLGSKYGSANGISLVASAGVIGFAFKEKAFSLIENLQIREIRHHCGLQTKR
jgi:preprotein translocase subunit SecY